MGSAITRYENGNKSHKKKYKSLKKGDRGWRREIIELAIRKEEKLQPSLTMVNKRTKVSKETRVTLITERVDNMTPRVPLSSSQFRRGIRGRTGACMRGCRKHRGSWVRLDRSSSNGAGVTVLATSANTVNHVTVVSGSSKIRKLSARCGVFH